jgi:hypothetical protein
MAISGAYGAGFVKGFANSMEKRVEKRFDQQQRYVDNMMENARRFAPKYAQDKATADATVSLMNEFETRYGVSNEEFIAMSQVHDVNKVYEAIQIAEQGLRDGQKLDVRGNILSALKVPEGAKLPEGMTAEDAVRSMVLGYAQTVSEKPDDTSESHKNRSWAKSISNVLALNPRASAEEQISAMKVAGVPVQEILQYQAAAGGTYKPLQNVTRTGVLDFSDDYKDSDFETSSRSFTRTFNSILTKSEDLALAGADTLEEAMANLGVDSVQALANATTEAGVSMADLELDLANNGMRRINRDRALTRLGSQVNMGAEMTALKEAVDSGLAMRMIEESLEKNGKLTQEYIDAILSNREVEQVKADEVTAAAQDTPAFLSDPTMPTLGGGTVGGPDVDDRPSMPVMPEDEVDTAAAEPEPEAKSLIDTIKSNQESQDSGILPSGMIAGNAATVAQQQEDYIERTREAASKITYSAYERMLKTKAGREELKEMGLPTQKFRTGKDRALAFGVMNPEQYFAPEPDAVTEEEPKSEAPMTRTEFQTSDDGLALLNYLMDEEELTAEDSLEDIKDAVAAWFGANPTINVGAEVTAEDVAKSMKQTLTLLAQED